MNKKNKLLILFIFISLLLILILIIINKPRETNNIPDISPPKPSIPSYIEDEIKTSVQITKSAFNFPSELPLIIIEPKVFSKVEAIQIAKNLGFEGEPEEFTDIDDGIKYFWRNSTNSLIITPKFSTVFYSTLIEEIPEVTNQNLSDDEITSLAESFLEKQNTGSSLELTANKVETLEVNPASEGLMSTSREKVTLYRVSFQPKEFEYPITPLNPNMEPTYVQLLPNGQVYKSNSLHIKSITKGLTDYKLKNLDDVKNNIAQAKIIELSNIYSPLSDFKGSDFTNVNLTDIGLIYLLEDVKKTTSQPVFLLKGTGTIISENRNVGVSFYLPAYK